MRLALAIGAAFLLSGCAHQVLLIPRDGGPVGKGSAPATLIRSNGELTVDFAGKLYRGTWVYMPNGGFVGTSFGTAVAGGQVATGTGTIFGASTNGNGMANLRADDGSTIQCRFNYSQWTDTGIGVCQGDGRVFDLQIHD